MFNQLLTIEISASSVVWYEIIIATFSMFVSLLNYLRDKGRIKVKLSKGLLACGYFSDKNVKIFIEAIN
ncbi:MAG: hypothetical protein PHO28_03240 [Candidatus Pacebacteria bacterium]|nr:hypothetical protein [Candidatus Paceibacterota bacterium]